MKPEDTKRENVAVLSGLRYRGYLPHLKEQGATYFVIFHLYGTLPHTVTDDPRSS